MSDVFNHEADAWDDYSARFEAGDDNPGGWYDHRCKTPFNYNPMYYHRRVKYKYIAKETEAAYLFVTHSEEQVWVPKSLCRDMRKKTVAIWRNTHGIEKFTDS